MILKGMFPVIKEKAIWSFYKSHKVAITGELEKATSLFFFVCIFLCFLPKDTVNIEQTLITLDNV